MDPQRLSMAPLCIGNEANSAVVGNQNVEPNAQLPVQTHASNEAQLPVQVHTSNHETVQVPVQANAPTDLIETTSTSVVNKSGKRLDYIVWDEFFMAAALLAAQRSKDPNTQVGAVIVDNSNVIIAIGYNGFPRGCSDDELPWGKDHPDPLQTKYHFVCHAEMNAVLNRNHAQSKGASIYTTLYPCANCAKTIIQAGIKTVVYLKDKPTKVEMQAARIMFEKAGIETRQFVSKRSEVVLKFH